MRFLLETIVDKSLFQEQRKAENEGVTEDDVNEIKNDISAFRFSKIISIVIHRKPTLICIQV